MLMNRFCVVCSVTKGINLRFSGMLLSRVSVYSECHVCATDCRMLTKLLNMKREINEDSMMMLTGDAYSSGYLVPSHFGTCICSTCWDQSFSRTCRYFFGYCTSNIPRYFLDLALCNQGQILIVWFFGIIESFCHPQKRTTSARY